MSCSANNSPVLLSLALEQQNSGLKRKRSPSKEPESGLSTGTTLISHLDKRPKLLRIIIPSTPLNSGLHNAQDPSPTSLFSASDSENSLFDESTEDESTTTTLKSDSAPALRAGPPVPGLYFDPSVLLPQDLSDSVVSFCMKTYFLLPEDNQVMLFGRFGPSDPHSSSSSGLPRILLDLLDTMAPLLRPIVPPETYELLFPTKPTQARQAIINLYHPGEGITPHVDLLGRYGDGIVGVSFSSGCVMRFDKVDPKLDESDTQNRWDLYLPERSMVVLTESARYGWTHGIEKKTRDFVSSEGSTPSQGSYIDRGIRMSITFRWLLQGADVVGEP